MRGPRTTNGDGFARSVLYHAIAHGDRIGRDAEGRVVIALAIPEPEFEALAAFDPDGDPDAEPDLGSPEANLHVHRRFGNIDQRGWALSGRSDREEEAEGGDDTAADARGNLA